MQTTRHNANEINKLQDKIGNIEIAMLSTQDETGQIRSRPMQTLAFDEDESLWFLMTNDSPKVEEMTDNNQVNLSYVSLEDNSYVSVSGAAQILKDQDKIDELWRPEFKRWVPDGKDDPALALLKVNVHKAEYWDDNRGTMESIIDRLQYMTNTQNEAQEQEHAKIRIS